MIDYLHGLMSKYKSKGVLLDTNLALLYVVGSLDSGRIRRHKRTVGFTVDDFERVSKFVDFFDKKIVTPNILTETSNLLGRDKGLLSVLASYIETANEEFFSSKETSVSDGFLYHGLTDAGIAKVAKEKYLVVTDDNRLIPFLYGSKVDVVSLSLIRRI